MKQVFKTEEVAHIWASQKQDSGRNSFGNFYFEKDIIYSYGKHFPIARIIGNDVLFTLRGYSNTTSKHIYKTRQAISHKNIIWCYYVPTFFGSNYDHNKNVEEWKRQIKTLFSEVGNKRIRDINKRTSEISYHIENLNTYCTYFKFKIKDKELKGLIKMSQSNNLIQLARAANEMMNVRKAKETVLAKKAFDKYIDLWRKWDNEGIKNLSEKTKSLISTYRVSEGHFTRLRYDKNTDRIETSKGVQIPAKVAKQAYLTLNGCLSKACHELSIPVMGYTITETTKDALIAGCHTIPKQDVTYIANLLGWQQ